MNHPPEVKIIFDQLIWEAKQTGKPARMSVGDTKLICYYYYRSVRNNATVSEGSLWKIKRPGEKYKSCSVGAAQELISAGVSND